MRTRDELEDELTEANTMIKNLQAIADATDVLRGRMSGALVADLLGHDDIVQDLHILMVAEARNRGRLDSEGLDATLDC